MWRWKHQNTVNLTTFFTFTKERSVTAQSWWWSVRIGYNRRQNELRHFALHWAFLRFTDFKRGKYSFSSPILSMQCCAAVQATYRKQQTPQLWMEGTGEGCGFFSSPIVGWYSMRVYWLGKKQVSVVRINGMPVRENVRALPRDNGKCP